MNLEKVQMLLTSCEKELDLQSDAELETYGSLSVCLLDCVYSLRATYAGSTLPVVDRYAAQYLNGDRHQSGDTLSAFMERIDREGGCEAFAESVLKNRQKIAGRSKCQICYDLADKLSHSLGIETLEDFQNYAHPELIEDSLRSVKGIGTAGLSYLFMLAGDESRCKPDVHLHRFVEESVQEPVSDGQCQELLTKVVELMKEQYPSMTVRKLDYLIWKKGARGTLD